MVFLIDRIYFFTGILVNGIKIQATGQNRIKSVYIKIKTSKYKNLLVRIVEVYKSNE